MQRIGVGFELQLKQGAWEEIPQTSELEEMGILCFHILIILDS